MAESEYRFRSLEVSMSSRACAVPVPEISIC
jgi:hypothetical protein